MNKETFGTFIAKIRKEKGLTQQGIADQLHVTDKAVSKWERGLCYPDLTLMEDLASALDLTVTELMACQRQAEEKPSAKEDAAVRSLLDISHGILKVQRKTIWLHAMTMFIFFLVLAAGSFYFSASASDLRETPVAMKQTEGDAHFVFIEEGGHLLRLRCPDQETYDSIEINNENEYRIQYRWNRLTYRGSIENCELVEKRSNLGGPMDQIGASTDFGSILGIDCVWMEYRNIYPDPDREGAWLFTYRLWYSGDGADYFAEGEETTLCTVDSCRSLCADDYDEDGVVELIVFTRYDEEPYMLYDLENGELVMRFLEEVPEQVMDFFQRDTSWY